MKEMFTINNVDEITDLNDSYSTKIDNLFTRIAPNFSNDRHSLYRFLQPPPSIYLESTNYSNKITNWNADVHLIANYCFLTKEESSVFALNEQKYYFRDVKYAMSTIIWLAQTKSKLIQTH